MKKIADEKAVKKIVVKRIVAVPVQAQNGTRAAFCVSHGRAAFCVSHH